MTDAARRAAQAARTALSYKEFKLKLDLSGIDLYNIDVVRSVRCKFGSLDAEIEFRKDIFENIDRPGLETPALAAIRDAISGRRSDRNDVKAFLATIWLRKHGHEYIK